MGFPNRVASSVTPRLLTRDPYLSGPTQRNIVIVIAIVIIVADNEYSVFLGSLPPLYLSMVLYIRYWEYNKLKRCL